MLPVEASHVETAGGNQGMVECPDMRDFAKRRPHYFDFFQLAELDIALPDIVSKAITLGANSLEGFLPPVMYISKAGHDSIGAVFYIGDLKKNDFEVERSILDRKEGVAARVSYGADSRETGGWSLSDIDRLHISAYAFRRFLPIDKELARTLSPNECLINEVHLSLRWQKEEGNWRFDDPYDDKMHRSSRTAWMRTLRERYYADDGLMKKESFIPAARELDKFGQPLKHKNGDVLEQMKTKKTSHSGYEVVADFLSRFGDVKPSVRIEDLSPEEGTQYLFQRIVPAMRTFIS